MVLLSSFFAEYSSLGQDWDSIALSQSNDTSFGKNVPLDSRNIFVNGILIGYTQRSNCKACPLFCSSNSPL